MLFAHTAHVAALISFSLSKLSNVPGSSISDIFVSSETPFSNLQKELNCYFRVLDVMLDAPPNLFAKEDIEFLIDALLRLEGLVWRSPATYLGTHFDDNHRTFLITFALKYLQLFEHRVRSVVC